MVVPYPAGGATEVIGRIVADQLQAMWRTTVIVENVSGAAGSIGMDRVAKGPPDGTQILMVPPLLSPRVSFFGSRYVGSWHRTDLPTAAINIFLLG